MRQRGRHRARPARPLNGTSRTRRQHSAPVPPTGVCPKYAAHASTTPRAMASKPPHQAAANTTGRRRQHTPQPGLHAWHIKPHILAAPRTNPPHPAKDASDDHEADHEPTHAPTLRDCSTAVSNVEAWVATTYCPAYPPSANWPAGAGGGVTMVATGGVTIPDGVVVRWEHSAVGSWQLDWLRASITHADLARRRTFACARPRRRRCRPVTRCRRRPGHPSTRWLVAVVGH